MNDQPAVNCEASVPSGVSWRNDAVPVSAQFDDVYFSVDDGLAESRHVFLSGCGLPDLWHECARTGQRHFVVGETGFGTGLNFLALWDLWQRQRPDLPPDCWLHFGSVELYPLSPADMARALACWPELAALSRQLMAIYRMFSPGFHRLTFPEARITLTLMIGDAAEMFSQWSARVDAWFLDGFSPACNPQMWRPEVMAQLARLSYHGTRLSSFTVARMVRDHLGAAGFTVQKARGYGRKRDMIRAVFEGPDKPLPPRPGRIAILGAGIAGAMLARHLHDYGIDVCLYDPVPHPASGASGNPVGLVMPKLQLGITASARFHRAAFRRALDFYRDATPPQAGVLQLAKDPAAAERMAKLVQEHFIAADEVVLVDACQANNIAALAVDKPGLWVPAAGWVRPAQIVQDLLPEQCFNGGKIPDHPENSADHVIIAAGLNSKSYHGLHHLPLRARKGQITQLAPTPHSAPLNCCITEGRYFSPVIDGSHILGATFDHLQDGAPIPLNPIDADDDADQRNIAHLGNMLPVLAREPWKITNHRAGIRATTPDHLPIVGRMNRHYSVLTGLGSSGVTTAALCADIVLAQILGMPMPVEHDVVAALDWMRFQPAQ